MKTSELDIESTKKKIRVMQAYVEGKPCESKRCNHNEWTEIQIGVWDWGTSDFRIKPDKKMIASERELKFVQESVYQILKLTDTPSVKVSIQIRKHKITGQLDISIGDDNFAVKQYYVFDPENKCWEDREHYK